MIRDTRDSKNNLAIRDSGDPAEEVSEKAAARRYSEGIEQLPETPENRGRAVQAHSTEGRGVTAARHTRRALCRPRQRVRESGHAGADFTSYDR
jgi:hypothetical protein